MAWMCNVLKHYHFQIGPYEEHDAVEPPPKPPAKQAWHIALPAFLCMGPFGALTGKPVKNVISGAWGDTMQRGTDIGPGILHFSPTHPLNTLYGVIIIGSASKSEFGVANTKAGNDVVAVAIACKINFNLNCWGLPKPPLPDGIVVTWNTVAVGATLTDLVCGLISMIIDSAIQYGLNRLFAYKPLGRWLTKLNDRIFPNLLVYTVGRGFLYKTASAAVDVLLPTAIGIVLGSPLGISGVNIPQKVFHMSDWWSPLGAAPGLISNPLDAYQKHVDNPEIDEHPSSPPPAPAAAPPPASTPPPTPAPPPPAPSADAGAPPPSPPPADAGAPPPSDAGAPPPSDAGAPPPSDAGAPPGDAGAPRPPDAGAPKPPDAGAPAPDAGAPRPKSGGTPPPRQGR